jgi:HD-GYP domain-containing protein (c-di-GMP phosphodiesterase class II)
MTTLPPPPSEDPSSDFVPLPIGHLFPNMASGFEVYLRHGDSHTLFSRDGERFSARHRALLMDYGVDTVYIHREEQERYRDYLRRLLPKALLGEDMTLKEKSAAFYHNCCDIVRDLIRDRLPQGVTERHGRKFMTYVRDSVEFLTTEAGLARVAALMEHDYEVYSHGVHVFVYTVFLLQALGLPGPTIVQAGVGALLHDTGKEDIPLSILKKPSRLSPEEFLAIREHPERGIRLCRSLSLSRVARECIFMHHEKLNGQGYPRGLSGEAIPVHARAVALSDVYDALTSKRVYAGAVRPFEALRIMRHDMAGSFDNELFRRFVMLLSGASLV